MSFILAIFESGWDQLYLYDEIFIRDSVTSWFGQINKPKVKISTPKELSVKKIPPLVPSCLSKAQVEQANKWNENCKFKKRNNSTLPLPYAQATITISNILKIKKAFPALPHKKLIKIHKAIFPKSASKKKKKIQYTTKNPSRKQAIVSLSKRHIDNIMKDTSTHIFYINNAIKNIKSSLRVEFIYICARGIFVNTNNILVPSGLSTIE